MPTNTVVSEEELVRLEEGGGLEEETLKTRDRHYKFFLDFVTEDVKGVSIEELLGSEAGRQQLTTSLGKFFFTLRVKASDDGEEKHPKRSYAEKIRSSIKCSMIDNFKVDITDPILFPEASKKWKSFISELVVQGRAEVDHHEEVDPVTMEDLQLAGKCENCS